MNKWIRAYFIKNTKLCLFFYASTNWNLGEFKSFIIWLVSLCWIIFMVEILFNRLLRPLTPKKVPVPLSEWRQGTEQAIIGTNADLLSIRTSVSNVTDI